MFTIFTAAFGYVAVFSVFQKFAFWVSNLTHSFSLIFKSLSLVAVKLLINRCVAIVIVRQDRKRLTSVGFFLVYNINLVFITDLGRGNTLNGLLIR